MKHEFECTVCHQNKVHESNFSTGYATNDKGEKICFDCCGDADKNYLLEHGKLSGYFSKNKDGKYHFTNWPGTFTLPVFYTRKSWHNFAGKDGRTDFWIKYNGAEYHGVQIGHNNECATIRKTKNKVI